MPNRTSARVKAKQKDALKIARESKEYKRLKAARKSKSGDKEYEEGMAGSEAAAQSGQLYRMIRELVKGDDMLDPGVEVRSSIEGLEPKRKAVEEALSAKERRELKVILTRNGAIQVRSRATGRVVKNPVPSKRGKGGKFTKDVQVSTVVVDEDKFKAAQEERAKNLQTGFLSPKKETKLRRIAILKAIEDDRKARGWDGVPDLD